MTTSGWTVYVDDNFNYGDEDERYCLGTFDSYDAAVTACMQIVDAFLQGNAAETAEALYDQYTSFGEDPWVSGPMPEQGSQKFSAWTYALNRCHELRPERAAR